MESILGIVAGCLGPAIEELGKRIAEPIMRQFNYLCFLNDNVQNLQIEAKKLEEAIFELESKVNTAVNNAENIVPQVMTWFDEVSKIQNKMSEIDSQIAITRNDGSTFGSRYSLNKKVIKMTAAMKELRESGSFTTISHPPPPAAMVSIRLRSIFEFDSRTCAEEEIMASLKDEDTNMVGICGMGGVGKTTMAKTIMHRAREELGFEETVMTVVSQDVDKFKIQVDIATSLGLSLSTEGSLSSKAHELRTRLKAGTRKSLVVIDDVWEKLELEELGIPCNSSRCKVLITSRNSHILNTMEVEKLHEVQVLLETEAWELFKSKAGRSIEQENVVSVAKQVVDECKGLPIALVTVALALKDTTNISSWNTVLRQLKSANPRHMPDVLNFVYQPLRLSYEMLESEEHRSLFLLCCLFPEDDDIPIEKLVISCMGLHMYEDIASLRDETCYLVYELKSRFLLLEGCDENHVKMHDVVRDVAIFIASEEKRIKCNGCTWISPNTGERTGAHGGSSHFPNLRLLWIDELEIHDDIFEGMSELNKSWIRCRSLQRLPQTIGLLKNLRTLVLEWCVYLEDISMVGELVNLEILICRSCSEIKSLPVEVGRLSHLRLLELSSCWNLCRIGPGIISNLTKLEELIVEYFDGWEARNVEGARKNAPLCELEHLSSLTHLKIQIEDYGVAAEQLRLSPNMLKFHITIGYEKRGFFNTKSEKTMRLAPRIGYWFRKDRTVLGKWIHECARGVECMFLEGDSSSDLDLRLALNLRQLNIKNCLPLKKLVTHFPLLQHLELKDLYELEEIRDIQHNLASNFNNLSSIIIDKCGTLRSLFSSSVTESGGCFLQLESLWVRDCKMMEQVFLWDEVALDQTNIIHIPLLFPKLKFIELDSLPSLTSFTKGIQGIEFPQLAEMSIIKCPLLKDFIWSRRPDDHHYTHNDYIHFFCKQQEVVFGYLRKLKLDGDKVRGNWCPQIPIDSFVRLRELKVSGYKGMKSLFSMSMTTMGSCLLQLEILQIERCDMMEQVFLRNIEEEEDDQTNSHILLVFQKLKFMKLKSLPSLTSFIKGIEGIEFPQRAIISIVECPLLKGFVCRGSSIGYDDCDNSFIHFSCKLHEVKFGKLNKLNVEMGRNFRLASPIDSFTGLLVLRVSRISVKSLFSFCTSESYLFLLETLEIRECDMMEQVFLWNEEETQRDNHITVFPNLKDLLLDSLPRLMSLTKGIESIHLPVPAVMKIRKCPLLQSCVSSTSPIDGSPHIHLFCKPDKVEFDRLEQLTIYGYDNKLRRNWCPHIPMIDLFAGLCHLNVSGLKGMESLFPCSIARMMPNIKSFTITRCKEMVRVIEVDAQTQTQTTTPNLLFSNLESIFLYGVPKLRSFCEWRCALHLPSLDYLYIKHCDVMKELTSGPLYTPNLRLFETDYHDSNPNDVNSTLQLNSLRREEKGKALMLDENEDETEEEEVKEVEMYTGRWWEL